MNNRHWNCAKLHISIIIISIMAAIAIFPVGNIYAQQPNAEKYIRTLDKRAKKIKKNIRKTKTEVEVSGTIYYVATNGNDLNDGLTPKTPIKSISKVNSLQLNSGDAVMFRRGGLWRGHIRCRKGVTYSAYGKGNKPKIFGSPCDAAKNGKWVQTEVPNIYVYDSEISDDIGTLVFNHGKDCAFKVMKITQDDGSTIHIETHEAFANYQDLKRDLDFYHDYENTKRVYLYSKKGNPAKRFKSIELLVKGNIMQATDSVTIDNLCIMYGGSHGIGCGTAKGLSVTNCELGWIGGSIQATNIFGRNHPTRYGNAIEIYGGCDSFLVDNCYIYQIYDAAITHQHQGNSATPLKMHNITYSNNLIEDCVYSIEYFLGKSPIDSIHHSMKNVSIINNIMRRAGEGWGKQRPDKETPAHIKSWTHYNIATNFSIRNNIFDRSTYYLLNVNASQPEYLPIFTDNVYIQYANGKGLDASRTGIYTNFDQKFVQQISQRHGEVNAIIYHVETANPH